MFRARRLRIVLLAAFCPAWSGCAATEVSQPSAAADAERFSLARDTRSHRRVFVPAAPKIAAPEISPQACSEGFQPAQDTASDLDRLAASCAQSIGLIAITPVFTGAFQDASSAAERLQFKGRKDHCYRILSVGEAGIADLDIAVFDSEGRLAAADVSSDRFPMVPPRGFLCLKQEETFTIEIASQQGAGRYLLQVWGSAE